MKANILFLTIFSWFLGFTFFTANADKLEHLRTSKKIVSVSHLPTSDDFAVQIIALKLPANEPGFFNNIENAREFTCSDGYVRYTVESFATYNEAKAMVDHYKELGYVQSFVVNCADYILDGSVKNRFDPNANYTVQLSAFRFPVYLSHFDGVDNVMEFYMKDRVYRYTVGSLKHEAAEVLLAELKKKGYKDAYITALDPYLPFQIE
ncbi:hypothetical protein [Saccharicrinis aurantiacus]|uniref:hypothetical protein n=1 Tax=Saccharicrinis aurantiacus TaxID=1849719 RepID=UPI0008383C2F|nr:hypothetical protein [Saccharicrinis aurantiacus]